MPPAWPNAATLVSEDLTCVASGLLVAQGRIDLFTAVLACFLGILIGDALLFWAGRILGRPWLRRRPLKWFLDEQRIEAASVLGALGDERDLEAMIEVPAGEFVMGSTGEEVASIKESFWRERAESEIPRHQLKLHLHPPQGSLATPDQW